MLVPGVASRNSLRSSNSAQTSATSQITKCVCPSAHAPTPAPALLGAASRGGERGHRRLLLRSRAGCRLRAARCRRLGAIAPPRPSAAKAQRAERSNGPSGARSHPLLTVPRSAGPGVSACRRTRASLSDSPRLFERRSPAGRTQRVPRCTPGPSIAGCPRSPTGRTGDADWGSPFLGPPSFGDAFLWRSKEQVPRPPGRDPASALHQGMQPPSNHKRRRQRSATPYLLATAKGQAETRPPPSAKEPQQPRAAKRLQRCVISRNS